MMKDLLKNPRTYIVLVALLVGVFYLGNSMSEDIVVSNDLDGFAQFLTDEGVKMYGTEWCSHCQNQKKLFGDSFQYVDFVDCDENKDECSAAGVTGYPTWRINNQNYPGAMDLSELKRITGYSN